MALVSFRTIARVQGVPNLKFFFLISCRGKKPQAAHGRGGRGGPPPPPPRSAEMATLRFRRSYAAFLRPPGRRLPPACRNSGRRGSSSIAHRTCRQQAAGSGPLPAAAAVGGLRRHRSPSVGADSAAGRPPPHTKNVNHAKQNMQKICILCKKYAKNMPKICEKYAKKYAQKL